MVEDRGLESLVPVAVLSGPCSSQVVLHCEEALPGLPLTPVIIQGAAGAQRSADPRTGSAFICRSIDGRMMMTMIRVMVRVMIRVMI